jgi:hypothetical protein
MNVRLSGPGREDPRPQEQGQNNAIKFFNIGHKPAKLTEKNFEFPAGTFEKLAPRGKNFRLNWMNQAIFSGQTAHRMTVCRLYSGRRPSAVEGGAPPPGKNADV